MQIICIFFNSSDNPHYGSACWSSFILVKENNYFDNSNVGDFSNNITEEPQFIAIYLRSQVGV